MRLPVELVPKPLWRKTLSKLSRNNRAWRSHWNIIRAKELSRTKGMCEVCGDRAEIVHEKWEYDDVHHVQKLAGFETVCRECSNVHHLGLASVQGHGEEAIAHFTKVNNLSREEAQRLLNEAGRLWIKRSGYAWTQELTWLSDNARSYGLQEQDVPLAEELLRGL